jgi:hypothetical protein
MERLTWDGVALHAGGLPGFPSSHGCVHLPRKFSQLLYGVTSIGSTVVIAEAHGAPEDVLHPGLLSPSDAEPGQQADGTARAAADYVWQPERSPEGPVNILISGADRMIYVFAPSGRVLETHPVPVDRPTNCTFGGAALGTLYVTSGGGHLFSVRESGRRGWLLYPRS